MKIRSRKENDVAMAAQIACIRLYHTINHKFLKEGKRVTEYSMNVTEGTIASIFLFDDGTSFSKKEPLSDFGIITPADE